MTETMTPERWKAIQSLFTAVADLDEAARDAFLSNACANDMTLRHEVEALLAAERHARDAGQPFLTDAIAAAAHGLLDESPVARAGERVGTYRLVREVGHGGMGAVYLAERADEEYHAMVAIKFVRGGLAAPDLERRFRTERQILANLTHPNIAWLFDAGTTPDGTPYLVMEYVDGEPIDQWCERHAVGLRKRIALFCEVCAAVQHAHQALVVHRDLKPSNILVTANGAAKLVDFGIAKLLAATDDADVTATQTLLTPTYAAPEQVRGGRITVATDVYGLGGVLYKLLTGRTPVDLANATAGEIERRICEAEPPRPSASATGSAAAWRRRLEGDLDTIVLKALSKEPERRYASVEQLSDDLRRYVDGLPVRARGDTLRYRSGKFVRRHRAAIAAASVVLIAIAGLTGFYTVGLARERDKARLEATKASEISAFLTNLFQQSDPRTSRGKDVTARELLDRGAERVERQLAGQPAVQGTLLGTISRVYHSLGLYDEAARSGENALAKRRALLGDTHADVAESLATLGEALYNKGDGAGAEKHYREALRIRRALHKTDHADLVDGLGALAWVLFRNNVKLDEAEALYRDAIAMKQRIGGDQLQILQLNDGLASTLQRKGDNAGAVPLLSENLALVRKQSPVDSISLATVLNNLSIALADQGRFTEAEPLSREAYAIYSSFYGVDHPYSSSARMGLSRVLHDLGRLDEAKALALEALRFDSIRLGAGHATIAIRLSRIGSILSDQARYAEAEPYYHRALAIRRTALGPDHPYTGISINELANFYRVSGSLVRAETGFREALALRRRIHPATHPYLAFTLTGLGTVLLDRDNAAEAEPLLREALAIREATLPPGHWQRAETESVLGGALVKLGRQTDGEQLMVASYEALNKTRGPAFPPTRQALDRLIAFYEKSNRPAETARYRSLRAN